MKRFRDRRTRGATTMEYLMMIAVVAAIAFPFLKDPVFTSMRDHKQRMVGFIAQDRKQRVPEPWFQREPLPPSPQRGPSDPPPPPGGGPDDGPQPDSPPVSNNPPPGEGPRPEPGPGSGPGPNDPLLPGAPPRLSNSGPGPGSSIPLGSPRLADAGGLGDFPSSSPPSTGPSASTDSTGSRRSARAAVAQDESENGSDAVAESPSRGTRLANGARRPVNDGAAQRRTRLASAAPEIQAEVAERAPFNWLWLLRLLILLLIIVLLVWLFVAEAKRRRG